MLFVYIALGGALLGVWIYTLIDAAKSDATQVRTLTKGQWLFVLAVTNFAGCLLWPRFGRPKPGAGPGPGGSARRSRRPAPGAGPEDDPEYLEWLRRQLPGDTPPPSAV
ncbi:MAG: hypothetical protein M3P91_10910 [Actinomycetota bacterium]|nr:hypothetical protein [Actinomycetota bacterium]